MPSTSKFLPDILPTTRTFGTAAVYYWCSTSTSISNVFLSLRQNFPAEGSRKAVIVEVSRTSTCETVCESIAAQLDVADARVVIRDRRGGETYDQNIKLREVTFLQAAALSRVTFGLEIAWRDRTEIKSR